MSTFFAVILAVTWGMWAGVLFSCFYSRQPRADMRNLRLASSVILFFVFIVVLCIWGWVK